MFRFVVNVKSLLLGTADRLDIFHRKIYVYTNKIFRVGCVELGLDEPLRKSQPAVKPATLGGNSPELNR
jgi:hypothetical protein